MTTDGDAKLDPSDPRHPGSMWKAVVEHDLAALRLSLSTPECQAALRAPSPLLSMGLGRPSEPAPLLIQAIELHFERGALLLVQSGADIEERGRGGCAPLIAAAGALMPGLVAELIKRGADLDAVDHDGDSALHMAASRHFEDSQAVWAALSLAPGWPGVDRLNANGGTALARACLSGSSMEVEALLDFGADPNLPNLNGMTPLMLAARRGDAASANLLLARGARVDHEHEGLTALQMALNHDELGVFQELIAGGADLLRKNSHGRATIDHARRLRSHSHWHQTASLSCELADRILERRALAASTPEGPGSSMARAL